MAALPLRRLDDRMGDDMQAWCDTRLRAASRLPQWLSDAAQYYDSQVTGRLRDHRACDQLSRWRESVEHKIRIVRLIDLETTAARLEAALQDHPATRDSRKYAVDDLPRLTRRLIAEAENELHLFLALVYRLGYHSLLIYPFRPEPCRAPALRPTASPPGARQRFPSRAPRRTPARSDAQVVRGYRYLRALAVLCGSDRRVGSSLCGHRAAGAATARGSIKMANQEWQFREFPAPNGEKAAVEFLNEPLRQGRGEASATLRNNGTASLLWLEPGSLGNSTEPAWEFQEFPAPNGEADAVAFLNATPRQGRGEATATLRNDRTAGLVYLEPGSLGHGTQQTWQSQEFSVPAAPRPPWTS